VRDLRIRTGRGSEPPAGCNFDVAGLRREVAGVLAAFAGRMPAEQFLAYAASLIEPQRAQGPAEQFVPAALARGIARW